MKLDPDLCTQELANIPHNASVYTPVNSSVGIDAALDGKGMLHLRITDDGLGLREGDEERAFEKFCRGQGSPAGGTGLGLSIA